MTVAVVAVITGCGSDQEPPTPESTLLGRVPAGGSLPVIVTLAGQYVPEGALPDEHARQTQRQAINAAQTAVLAELSGFQVQRIYRYAYTPQLALSVDAGALAQLLRSQRVAAVQEDTARSPAGTPHGGTS